MKMGAEPKKLAVLAACLALAGVAYYVSSDSGPTPAPTPRAVLVVPAAATAVEAVDAASKADRKRAPAQANMGEFKPGIGPKRGEAKRDPTTIDPTLRLDLLAKVQNVQPSSSLRNLFAFGSAQVIATALPPMPGGRAKIPLGPQPLPPTPQPLTHQDPPPPPTAPPMTFKYYGYRMSKSSGVRTAFLLDGEDIILAAESDTVKKRYRIVKIDAKSITIEDTQFKKSQTLPLQEDVIA